MPNLGVALRIDANLYLRTAGVEIARALPVGRSVFVFPGCQGRPRGQVSRPGIVGVSNHDGTEQLYKAYRKPSTANAELRSVNRKSLQRRDDTTLMCVSGPSLAVSSLPL
jgi:hypothetical protein